MEGVHKRERGEGWVGPTLISGFSNRSTKVEVE